MHLRYSYMALLLSELSEGIQGMPAKEYIIKYASSQRLTEVNAANHKTILMPLDAICY